MPGASFGFPVSVALDEFGNVFVANANGNGSVSELTAASSYATGLNFNNSNTGSPGAAFDFPVSIAVDGSDNVFAANLLSSPTPGSVSELTAASGYATGLKFAPSPASLAKPESIAVDGAGNVFVANEGNSVSELTAASGYTAGLNFAPAGAAFDLARWIALDESGNVFVANESGGSVSEILGLAKPVITPVQSCLIYWSSHPGQACVP